MVKLSAGRDDQRKDGNFISYLLAKGEVFAGGIITVNTGNGYAGAGAPSNNRRFVGVSVENVDNKTGSDGDKSVQVSTNGVFQFNSAGLSQGDVGDEVYITDDQTVSKTDPGSNNGIKVGRIVEVESATSCRVRIDNYTN